jgi:tetratricopeptide (TPR) repeat protein
MKTERRHELETNVLARHVGDYLDRLGPHISTIAGVLIAIAVVMIVWSYLSGSSSARQSEAWNAYNEAMQGQMPNLEQLKAAAEQNPGTRMQDMANITWADGQVWMASQEFIQKRSAAMEALERAVSSYQSVIHSSDDPRLVNRARYGLGRVYEMQNQPEKAIEQYSTVEGAFAEFAKGRVTDLKNSRTQEIMSWLASATPPRRAAPAGPGTPGQRPAFSADDLTMPGETPKSTSANAAEGADAFNKLLEGLDLNKGESPDRYGPDGVPASGEAPPPNETPAGSK